ncbi:acetyl-CoA synthetase [Methanomicrobium sp. W14]|uniref:AMP-binding protein n=1 Tax=Methanomicrobium sp. W14 TaxID=2817839 RepID=UPI001AE4072C|nr:AMP-binding protein [Methanomicrobium sp. W14]MBP2132255.1 acetyl-CoA synthetase [Methanomicrobium sp. W14]
MVRFSVTMDDSLVEKIDRTVGLLGKSRSEWINGACENEISGAFAPGGGQCVENLLHLRDRIPQEAPNMTDYDTLYKNFKIDVPEYFNFGFDVIDTWAKIDRNKRAMVWVNQSGYEKTFSFRQLSNRSNQAANMLLKYGIKKGDRVAIMLPRVPEWWFFATACIKIGAVFVPCPTMLTSKDLLYRTNAAGFKMFITDMENAPKIEEICPHCPSLRSRLVVDGEKEGWISYLVELDYPAPVSSKLVTTGLERTRSSDPMVMYFTSGTTGEAKMVLHNHALPLGHLTTGAYWLDLKMNDVHMTLSDTGWAKSSWGKFFGPWIQGACSVVYDYRGKFNATEILPILEKYEVTSFCCPPTIYRMLIMADLDKFDLTSLRHCVSAGEPLNPEVIKVWKEGTGLTIYEGYGQTELTLCIGTFPCMKAKPGSMGKPSPGWRIELHDDDGNPVKQGEPGRIAVHVNPKPVGMFMEYCDNPDANAESFSGDFYYTGDKAYMDEDGYFWFVGRSDDVIKSSGYRIGPFEVESAIMEHPSVKEVAVVGSPDPIRGMVVKAFIILKNGYEPSEILIRDIQKQVKQTTAPYKYPRLIEFVDELPKTISGKIRRNVLRDHELKKHIESLSSIKEEMHAKNHPE